MVPLTLATHWSFSDPGTRGTCFHVRPWLSMTQKAGFRQSPGRLPLPQTLIPAPKPIFRVKGEKKAKGQQLSWKPPLKHCALGQRQGHATGGLSWGKVVPSPSLVKGWLLDSIPLLRTAQKLESLLKTNFRVLQGFLHQISKPVLSAQEYHNFFLIIRKAKKGTSIA